jgi:hypothetical protein
MCCTVPTPISSSPEAEITARLARAGCVFYGISYHGRTYAEGKKIGLKDAVRTLYAIMRYAVAS